MPNNPSSELASRFSLIEDFSEEWAEYGFRLLPLGGDFLRSINGDIDAFVFMLKATLPKDVRLYTIDGIAFRQAWNRDVWYLTLASKTWGRVPQGEELPKLDPWFTGEPKGNPVWDTALFSPRAGIGLEVRVNKLTHILEIPKDQETETEMILIVKPRQ